MTSYSIKVQPPTSEDDRLGLFDLLDVPETERASRLELRQVERTLEVVDSLNGRCLGRLPRGHTVVRGGADLHRITDFEVIGNGFRPAAAYLNVTVSEITDLGAPAAPHPGRW